MIFTRKALAIAIALFPHRRTEAATIDEWSKENVITQEGPYTPGETYFSVVYDSPKTESTKKTYGGILWKESDVQAPGMKVVTDGDGPESCVMTFGVDPENPEEPKQCNDNFQTSKRFKRYSDDANGPVDLVFNLSGGKPVDDVYRIFEKYENLTPDRLAGFKIQLGTGIGSNFEISTNDDGLYFTTREGENLASAETLRNIDLGAFFAFGLFGDASEEREDRHDTNGYYDPTARAIFNMEVTSEDELATNGVTENFAGLYDGSVVSWISKEQAPLGFFYDIDNDDTTDDLLVGDWDGSKWVTRLLCDSPTFLDLLAKSYVKPDECFPPPASGPVTPVPLSAATVNTYYHSALFEVGAIEDFGNVNVNYHIKVEDSFVDSGNDHFTLRVVPIADDDLPTPWLATLPTPPGAKGDPHFVTWKGEKYDYHGMCTLDLVSDPLFANGRGLLIQIRTKIYDTWSLIETAAIQLGNDVLEVKGSDMQNEQHYWINKQYKGAISNLDDFALTYESMGKYIHTYTIHLNEKEKIMIRTFKDFVRVDFVNPKKGTYGNTVGLLGDFITGKKLARDGFTVIEDYNEFGQEWQALPDGPQLFHDLVGPQLPHQQCVLPSELPSAEKRTRRLRSVEVTEAQAEEACKSAGVLVEDFAACVFDVMATDDLEMAGAY